LKAGHQIIGSVPGAFKKSVLGAFNMGIDRGNLHRPTSDRPVTTVPSMDATSGRVEVKVERQVTSMPGTETKPAPPYVAVERIIDF